MMIQEKSEIKPPKKTWISEIKKDLEKEGIRTVKGKESFSNGDKDEDDDEEKRKKRKRRRKLIHGTKNRLMMNGNGNRNSNSEMNQSENGTGSVVTTSSSSPSQMMNESTLTNVLSGSMIRQKLFPYITQFCDKSLSNDTNTKKVKYDKMIIFFLEMIYFLQLTIIPFGVNGLMKRIGTMISIEVYVGLYFLGLGYVIVLGLLIVFSLKCDFLADWVVTGTYLLFRITRTVFFYPVLLLNLLPLMCNWGYTNTYFLVVGGVKCTDMPYLLLIIPAVFSIVIIFVVSSIDILFILDVFKSVKYWTSCPNGRFNYVIFLLNFIFVVISCLFFYINVVKIIFVSGGILVYGILLLYLIRYIPYYNILYCFLIGLFVSYNFASFIAYLINLILVEYYYLLFIIIIPIVSLVVVILLIFRYIVVFKMFKKDIKRSRLFCNCAIDVAIICHLTKSKSVDSLKSTILKVVRTSIVKKSKSLLFYLIPTCLNCDYLFATTLYSHSRGLSKIELLDKEFIYDFFSDKICEHQTIGRDSNKKSRLLK